MRIVNSTFVSIDGVINRMDAWHFDYIDAETEQIATAHLRAADAMLMGRATYEAYAKAWPGRDGEYADLINAIPKYVASTTLSNPDWHNASVIHGDLVTFVRGLRERSGGDVLMHGFGPVAAALINGALLDILHLWIHPKFAGVGEQNDLLLRPGVDSRLTLRGKKALSNDVVILSYDIASD